MTLDIRRPALGDPLPETLENHSGVVVFGGPMSANDETDFIKRETEWLAVPLREQEAVSRHLSRRANAGAASRRARSSTHPEGKAEIGYYPIRITDAARGVTPDWPDHVYQWHREGFALPHGADLLAEGDIFEVQAFRYGPAAYGIQFHPEVTHAMMCRWTTLGHVRLDIAGRARRAPIISSTGRCTIPRCAPGSRRFSIAG